MTNCHAGATATQNLSTTCHLYRCLLPFCLLVYVCVCVYNKSAASYCLSQTTCLMRVTCVCVTCVCHLCVCVHSYERALLEAALAVGATVGCWSGNVDMVQVCDTHTQTQARARTHIQCSLDSTIHTHTHTHTEMTHTDRHCAQCKISVWKGLGY